MPPTWQLVSLDASIQWRMQLHFIFSTWNIKLLDLESNPCLKLYLNLLFLYFSLFFLNQNIRSNLFWTSNIIWNRLDLQYMLNQIDY